MNLPITEFSALTIVIEDHLSVFMSKIVMVKCQSIGIASFSFDDYIFLSEIAMVT